MDGLFHKLVFNKQWFTKSFPVTEQTHWLYTGNSDSQGAIVHPDSWGGLCPHHGDTTGAGHLWGTTGW